MEFFFYLLLGAAAGTLAGLLGVGGGLIIVPALAFLLPAQEVSAELAMHLAIGTSLATIVFTSIASVRAHHRRRAVRWGVFWHLTPGIAAGALGGAVIASALPGESLRLIFAVFAMAVAAQLALAVQPPASRTLPGRGGMVGAGALIGAVSAVVGIGGGSLTVPFLVWCNLSIREAVATSAACGLPIAAVGALGYILLGQGEAALPPAAVGYVYLPALAGIALASVLFAPLGAHLAHRLPGRILQRVFALFLAAVGVRMLLST